MQGIQTLFSQLMNQKKITPYPFQIRAVEHILDKKDVLIDAPTGCGKAWAAILPYLYSHSIKQPCADKLIYALPLRSLANSLYLDHKECIHRWDKQINITLQTGEHREDELFEGDIVFTTIDQALSAYLNIPLPLPKKLATINAGVFVGGMLVVDEIHLLDDKRALSTLAVMRKNLSGLCRFVLMSATLTPAMENYLMPKGSTELIKVFPSDEELNQMPPATRTKSLSSVQEKINADFILSKHQGKSLVICNTIRTAQSIYEELHNKIKKQNLPIRLRMIHSRFLPEDRVEKESELVKHFGKYSSGENIILITTQIVEAGMDLSAMDLFTQCAPADSLIQRMGRCARFNHQQGRVWIFQPDEKNNLPYPNTLVFSTWQHLSNFNPNIPITTDLEKHLNYSVHQQEDQEQLTFELYKDVENKVKECHTRREKGYAQELIRDVQSVQLAITHTPELLKAGSIKGLFSIHPGMARKLLSSIPEIKQWTMETDEQGHLIWTEIDEKSKGKGFLSPLISIPSIWVHYSKESGLRIKDPEVDTPDSAEKDLAYNGEKKVRKLYSYALETYEDHKRKTLQCFNYFVIKHKVGFQALNSKWSWEGFKDLLQMAVEYHDYGKRSVQWQQIAHQWMDEVQREWRDTIKQEEDGKYYLAHTYFDPGIHIKSPRFPEHSALSLYCLPEELYVIASNDNEPIKQNYGLSCAMAVLNHHGGFTAAGLEDITMDNQTIDHHQIKDNADELTRMLYVYRYEALPIFWFSVRLLRLADQYATKSLNQNRKGGLDE